MDALSFNVAMVAIRRQLISLLGVLLDNPHVTEEDKQQMDIKTIEILNRIDEERVAAILAPPEHDFVVSVTLRARYLTLLEEFRYSFLNARMRMLASEGRLRDVIVVAEEVEAGMQCDICRQRFERQGIRTAGMLCGHRFHWNCIIAMRLGMLARCPACQFPL